MNKVILCGNLTKDMDVKIYNSINCDSEYCSCNECSNKYICEIVGNILNSMRNHYYKTTRN